MKKIYLILLGAGIMAGIAGCERFLDTENLTKRDTSNYPETEGEVSSLLTGVYSAARLMENDPNGRCSFIVSEILSDDRFGGGGPDDATYTNIEKFECDEPNMFEDTWSLDVTVEQDLEGSCLNWLGIGGCKVKDHERC